MNHNNKLTVNKMTPLEIDESNLFVNTPVPIWNNHTSSNGISGRGIGDQMYYRGGAILRFNPRQSRTNEEENRLKYKLNCTVNLIVSLLLCLGGTLWQLTSICQEYFSYAVVSEVSLLKVYDIEPPALSLCLPYLEMIGIEKFNYTTKDDKLFDREKLAQQIQETYSISTLFSLTPDITNLITMSWIRKTKSYDVDTDISKFMIKKYIRDQYVCYRFSHIDQSTSGFIYRSHHIQYGRKRGAIMGIRLNKTLLVSLIINRAIVYLHPVEMYPRGDRDYALHLISESNVFAETDTLWAISWTKVTQILLPPPFATGCRDNKELGYENKEHCQHSCVAKKAINKYGKSLFTLSQDKPNGYTVLSKMSLLKNRSLELEVDDWIEECNSTCWGHNCVKVNFCPLVTSTMNDQESVGFQIFDQNGPETRIVFIEKLSFVGFLVYILSIVGVWLGLSCLDISKTIIRLIARVEGLTIGQYKMSNYKNTNNNNTNNNDKMYKSNFRTRTANSSNDIYLRRTTFKVQGLQGPALRSFTNRRT